MSDPDSPVHEAAFTLQPGLLDERDTVSEELGPASQAEKKNDSIHTESLLN